MLPLQAMWMFMIRDHAEAGGPMLMQELRWIFIVCVVDRNYVDVHDLSP